MIFNAVQLDALEAGLEGKNFNLIGAAGTGKTTVTQTLISLLMKSTSISPLSEETKHLSKGAPGIVVVGFTNKAVNNLKKKLPTSLQSHCLTIHKLIEFAPVYYDIEDEETGEARKSMRFEPTRHAANPLPHISTIIFEESSMIGTDLFEQLLDALPAMGARTQMIFLGDLNQLPPIFGPSILGFKLASQPVVELTHVYRQALLSPIISLATAVRTNNSAAKMLKRPAKQWSEIDYTQDHLPWNLTEQQIVDREEHGKVTIRPWKKRVHEENAILMMKKVLPIMIDTGEYNPNADMILCPFNKAFGTIELNKIIGQHLAEKEQKETFEVIARYQKSYWCVGDRVLVDRQEAIIEKIVPTVGYFGKMPRNPSRSMDRWGHDPEQPNEDNKMTAADIMNALDRLETSDGEDDAKNLASHSITVYFPDLDTRETLDSAGQINSMLLAWALTVHKSQGSEWEKVFLFLHNTHAKGTLLSRELLYTAITRAKKELYIICEGDIGGYPNSIARAAEKPVIPGTTLKEKIAYFSEKMKSYVSGASLVRSNPSESFESAMED
jgi:ATP-dependent exoDNAse (exonuclease V) alpha subunit